MRTETNEWIDIHNTLSPEGIAAFNTDNERLVDAYDRLVMESESFGGRAPIVREAIADAARANLVNQRKAVYESLLVDFPAVRGAA